MSPLEALAAALTLGLASIPHCIAMCGPLAVLSCGTRERSGYLGARLLSYAAVGSAMGWLGGTALGRLGPAAGRWALILAALVCAWQGVRAYRRERTQTPRLVSLRRPSAVLAALPTRGAGLGIVTAVLPCGALAGAWAVAAASASPLIGAAAMALFALASTPALVMAIIGRNVFARHARRIPATVVAAAWLAGAALLLGRAWLATSTSCH